MRDRPAGDTPPPPRIVFTSGSRPSPVLAAALAKYGF
jgi:hypothetical protein